MKLGNITKIRNEDVIGFIKGGRWLNVKGKAGTRWMINQGKTDYISLLIIEVKKEFTKQI